MTIVPSQCLFICQFILPNCWLKIVSVFILCWSPYILFDLLQVFRLILHSLQSSSQTAIGEACSNSDILTISLMQTMLMLMLMLKLLLVDLLFILVMLFQTCAGLQSHPIFPCSRHLHPVPRPTQLRSKPPHLLPLLCQYWSDLVSTFRISILIQHIFNLTLAQANAYKGCGVEGIVRAVRRQTTISSAPLAFAQPPRVPPCFQGGFQIQNLQFLFLILTTCSHSSSVVSGPSIYSGSRQGGQSANSQPQISAASIAAHRFVLFFLDTIQTSYSWHLGSKRQVLPVTRGLWSVFLVDFLNFSSSLAFSLHSIICARIYYNPHLNQKKLW